MRHLLVAAFGLALGASCDDAFAACMRSCGYRGVREFRNPTTSGDSCEGFKSAPGVCICADSPRDGGQ